MNRNSILSRIRAWPRWTIIPIAIGLACLVIVLGLLLEAAGHALSPVAAEPEPTMPTIAYSAGQSDGCHDCHFSMAALESAAADPATAAEYLVQPESVVTPHGKLGCLACHGGDGAVTDKEAAHAGLVADMSARDPEKCIICHDEMPDEMLHDRLRVPHAVVVDRIAHGEPGEVHCSDCHGAVGHGYDPLSGEKHCSMSVCVDCHVERQLEVQMADCGACHLGPHDTSQAPLAGGEATCNDCHASTEAWAGVETGIHPVALVGKHGETACFACHQYPDFQGLDSACAACHEAGHGPLGDGDCAMCHDAGAGWGMAATEWAGHADYWDQYKGAHLQVSCQGCHFEGYDLDPGCATCHRTPESHEEGRREMACTPCHQADQAWDEGL
jgi:hypothetical protein